MTRAKTVLGFAAVSVAAALCASCAPEAPPQPQKKNGSETQVESGPLPDQLPKRIELAVEMVRKRDVLTTNGFWTVFHAILGLGPKTVELVNPETGSRVNALDYICKGAEVRGMRFVPTAHGVDVINGEMFGQMGVGQGHQDQFVAEMVQWGLSPDKKILVGGKEYRFQDFINHTKMRARVKAGQELSWAVLVIGQHFGPDAEWTNEKGEKLRVEDLMRDEVEAPINEAACGGTHRLFGLTWVYHLHLRNGGKTEGVWQRVADRIEEHKALAKKFRNSDGSFSTSYFRGRGDSRSMQERIGTTGHTLEWLSLAMTEEELKAPWVNDAAYALTKMLFDIQRRDMESGALYHAVHGLLLYYARLYDGSRLGAMQPHMVLPSDGPPWKLR
jgi:hypothetical protein